LQQGMPGMAFMMDAYEQELKRPIRNVVNGQLPRTLLIQVQIVSSCRLLHALCEHKLSSLHTSLV
jgi:ATP synthase regulation protein NCA2